MEKLDPSVPIYAEVPVPYTATGRISAMGLELYVRWFRAAGYDGVALWGRISRGDALDPIERDELFSTWRGGLPPRSAVAAILPFGGGSGSIDQHVEQAIAAREAGADVLIMDDVPEGDVASGETSALMREFEPPVFRVVETLGSTSVVESAAGRVAWVSGLASVMHREKFARKGVELDKALAEVERGLWPQMLLGALVDNGVLSQEMAYDRQSAPAMDARFLRLLRE